MLGDLDDDDEAEAARNPAFANQMGMALIATGSGQGDKHELEAAAALQQPGHTWRQAPGDTAKKRRHRGTFEAGDRVLCDWEGEELRGTVQLPISCGSAAMYRVVLDETAIWSRHVHDFPESDIAMDTDAYRDYARRCELLERRNDMMMRENAMMRAQLRATNHMASYRPDPSLLVQHWQKESNLQMAEVARRLGVDTVPFHRDFRNGFGAEDELQDRHERMGVICERVHSFVSSVGCIPQQPVVIYGREREGKTGAIFSITKAALLQGCAVIIFCAPAKIAAVRDMVLKLEGAGFFSSHNVTHTLGPKGADGLPCVSTSAEIMVASHTQVSDLRKASKFVEDNQRAGRRTVSIVDECDELNQGPGHETIQIPEQYDLHYVDDLPTSAAFDASAGTSSEESYWEESDSDGQEDTGGEAQTQHASRMREVQNVAKASAAFSRDIQPRSLCFLVTATHTATMLDKNCRFDATRPVRVVPVRKSRRYVGIHDFTIPSDCHVTGTGLMRDSKELFEGGSRAMLRSFFERRHSHDGCQLQHESGDAAKSMALRGMLFISVTDKVTAQGCMNMRMTIPKALYKEMKGSGQKVGLCPQWADTTLQVCFVGTPCAYFAGKRYDMPKGASLESIYNRMARQFENGPTCGGGGQTRFSDTCTHVILIGYNLTRRAMTAAFSPKDNPHVLFQILYVIARCGKSSKVDIDSQRIMRAGHDYGAYLKPDGMKVWISIHIPLLLRCQRFRRMEDDSMADQAQNPGRSFQAWMDEYRVTQNQMQQERVGKGNCSVGAIGNGMRGPKRCKFAAMPALDPFYRWMEGHLMEGDGRKASKESIDKYRRALEVLAGTLGLTTVRELLAVDDELRSGDARTGLSHLKKFAQGHGSGIVVLSAKPAVTRQSRLDDAMLAARACASSAARAVSPPSGPCSGMGGKEPGPSALPAVCAAGTPGGKEPVGSGTAAAVACQFCHDGRNWLQLGNANRCPDCGLCRCA